MRRRILNVRYFVTELLNSLRFEFNDDHTRTLISHLISTSFPFISPDNIIFTETPVGSRLSIYFLTSDNNDNVTVLSFDLLTLEYQIEDGAIPKSKILENFKYFC